MVKARLLGAVGIVVALAAITRVSVRAQADAKPLAFEVASVKVTPAGLTSISPYGQGRFTATKVSLELLISIAFDVADSYILQGPNWLASEYYDVTAKAEDGVNLTPKELRPRLQQLLAQRFTLATHREMKDLRGYRLVVTKDGPTLKAGTPGTAAFGILLPSGLRATNASMETLASMLARPIGRPVVNETSLTGNYDITLDYAPEAAADSTLPSIYTALEEQLGLKLETQTVPVEMLVIDHVDHPTPD